jgi:quercetin dioxygenase-like cupin family protein
LGQNTDDHVRSDITVITSVNAPSAEAANRPSLEFYLANQSWGSQSWLQPPFQAAFFERSHRYHPPSHEAKIFSTAFGFPASLVLPEKRAMKKILLVSLLAWIPLIAEDAKVTPLTLKPLPDIPGKEVEMILVEYPPGGSDPVHRHNAHALVYVLEGSIVMGLNGAKPVTLTPGQTFYEGPNDIHTLGRNASKTAPARFVVFLLKDKNAPVLIPVK